MKYFDAFLMANKCLKDDAESEWLIALSCNIPRGRARLKEEMTKAQEKTFLSALKKRQAGEPLQYIFKSANFYGFDLLVNKNVLIPRPETEELAEEALRHIKKGQKVLDIGTGSGAIAIAISKLAEAEVTAVDISAKALKVAKENAKRNGADIKFIKSSVFSAVSEKFDHIISNPPYIATDVWKTLDREVKDFEPRLALDGGADGLDFYRQIVAGAKEHLNASGMIFLEIGYDQAQSVCKLLEEDFKNIEVKKDLEGRDRIVFAQLK